MQQSNEINSLNIGEDAKNMLLFLMSENQRLQGIVDSYEVKLISTEEACKALGCGRKKFWEMAKKDNFPRAIKMGKSNHYKLNEILAIRDNTGLCH